MKKMKIPEFKTETEETTFWENHSFSECVEYTTEMEFSNFAKPFQGQDMKLLRKAEEDCLPTFTEEESKDSNIEESMMEYMKRTGSGVTLLKNKKTLWWIMCPTCSRLLYGIADNKWMYRDPICEKCNHMVMGLSNPFVNSTQQNS